MKAKKKKPQVLSQRTNRRLINRSKKVTKKTTARPKTKRPTAKKRVNEIKKPTTPKMPPPKKYYITINGKKINLENEIIKKYNLTPGDFLPFSRYKVFIER
jgi:hypothetical protein